MESPPLPPLGAPRSGAGRWLRVRAAAGARTLLVRSAAAAATRRRRGAARDASTAAACAAAAADAGASPRGSTQCCSTDETVRWAFCSRCEDLPLQNASRADTHRARARAAHVNHCHVHQAYARCARAHGRPACACTRRTNLPCLCVSRRTPRTRRARHGRQTVRERRSAARGAAATRGCTERLHRAAPRRVLGISAPFSTHAHRRGGRRRQHQTSLQPHRVAQLPRRRRTRPERQPRARAPPLELTCHQLREQRPPCTARTPGGHRSAPLPRSHPRPASEWHVGCGCAGSGGGWRPAGYEAVRASAARLPGRRAERR